MLYRDFVRNAVFCVTFIDDVTLPFFFLKVNIYFRARKKGGGRFGKFKGPRNLFPKCFRKIGEREKYIRGCYC